MTGYLAAWGRRSKMLFLLVMGLALSSSGQKTRAEQPRNYTTTSITRSAVAAEALHDQQAARTPNDGEEDEDEGSALTPLLRMQLLSAILITSADVLSSSSDNTRSSLISVNNNSSGSGDTGGNIHIQGDPTPVAPEPASLVLGALGSGFAAVGLAIRRRRRAPTTA